jgi:hypothetical protein
MLAEPEPAPNVTAFSADDFPHAPTDHAKWQESWVVTFRDLDHDVFGFVRVGSYVNEGLSQVHWGMLTADGWRFRRHRLDLPLRPEDRQERSVSAGPMTIHLLADSLRVTAEDDDASIDLTMVDYFASQPWHMRMGDISLLAGNHLESSGSVTGRVRLGDHTFEVVNGLGHRDHSWGPRDHGEVLNNRWFTGTMGPELSFSAMNVQTGDGTLGKAGWVARNGVVEHAVDINVVTVLLADGFSPVGGWAQLTLESGEQVTIDAEVVDGIVTSSHLPNGGPGSTPAGVEGLSIARSGSLEGFCDLNVNVNALKGESPVTNTLLANFSDGLSRRDPEACAWAYRAWTPGAARA